jgi:S-adenosylmethionine/arginine decarboxylase-like enzyme
MRETLWHYQCGAKQSRDAAFSYFLCKLEREEVKERERESERARKIISCSRFLCRKFEVCL